MRGSSIFLGGFLLRDNMQIRCCWISPSGAPVKSWRSVAARCRCQQQHDIVAMSRDATELPLGSTAAGGNRLLAEPAFELLLSEIIAYTGAYVSHTAASRATDVLRASEAGGPEEDELGDRVGGSEGSEDSDGGVLVEPSPASVGVGNALLPVSFSANTALRLRQRCLYL